MDSYPLMVAEGTLLFLAIVLVIEYAFRRREVSRQSAQNRLKQQQLATLSAELKNLKKKYARKSEIADQFPCIAKKMTEKLPLDAYPAIAVRSARSSSMPGKSDTSSRQRGHPTATSLSEWDSRPDWAGTVRIHADEGILGMALQKKMVVSRTDVSLLPARDLPRPSLENMGVSPDFVAPMLGVSGTVGALVVTGCPLPLEEERIYMSMLADLLSMALQNATLLDPSKDGKWVDQLTGVANRTLFPATVRKRDPAHGELSAGPGALHVRHRRVQENQRHVRPLCRRRRHQENGRDSSRRTPGDTTS